MLDCPSSMYLYSNQDKDCGNNSLCLLLFSVLPTRKFQTVLISNDLSEGTCFHFRHFRDQNSLQEKENPSKLIRVTVIELRNDNIYTHFYPISQLGVTGV